MSIIVTLRVQFQETASPYTSADAESHTFSVDLLDYQDGLHILEIIGFTHVTELLRYTLEFYGLGEYQLKKEECHCDNRLST